MADLYKEAGVDIEAGEEAVRRIKGAVASTKIPGVIGGVGGFGGLFDLKEAGISGDSVLVSGSDGVGTKLKIAFLTGRHDTIGIDCVAMCVNDILTLGARPLFFLDYIGIGTLEPGVVESVVSGIAEGCRQAGCALLGGETAEMPGFYGAGEYDVVGFAVGAVARNEVVDGSAVSAGDVIIGLPSSGVHSNGFSLVRKVLVQGDPERLADRPGRLTKSLGETLLEPTRIYAREVMSLLVNNIPVHAMAHITGGGLLGNIPRVLPDTLAAVMDQAGLDASLLPVFDLIRETGDIPMAEMYEVFNMGVGYVLIIPERSSVPAIELLGEGAVVIGSIVERESLGGAAIEIPAASG